MSQAAPRNRELDTIAALDLLAGAMAAGVVLWLLSGLSLSVNESERLIRLRASALIGPIALGLLSLGWAVLRRLRPARRLQRWAAILALPLLPVGTAWAVYILRLLRTDAGERFAREDAQAGALRPYWGVLTLAVALGSFAVTFGALKSRELWLESQVQQAAESVANQQQTVSRRVEVLRENGVVDTPPPAPPGTRR